MSENNEKKNSHKSSKLIPLPILRNLSYNGSDLPSSTIIPYRRMNSASTPLHLNSGASSSILHTQTNSSVELQPRNSLENKTFRRKSFISDSQTSTKMSVQIN